MQRPFWLCWTIWNALRVALGIFSGRIILNFGVQKRLRAFLNPIFTGRGERTPSGKAYGFASSLWEGAFGMEVEFLIALETLATGLTACALSVFASQIHTPPFVTCGDIFPRSGGSLSSKGEARVLPETFSLFLIL